METTRKKRRARIIIGVAACLTMCLTVAGICIFFDEAVLVRKGTVYRVPNGDKLIALTFDDGPSAQWTSQILKQLEIAGVHATFFMLGQHAEKYPEVARAVASGGHEIGNHSYDHRVLLYYGPSELEEEILNAEKAIEAATSKKTHYFRPPKAWLTASDKTRIHALGYETVLWSLNSKDWVTWDEKYIAAHIERHIQPGDIILFHDSGGVFATEGGDRHETVETIPRLVKALKQRGYTFVTVSELLANASRTEPGTDEVAGTLR